MSYHRGLNVRELFQGHLNAKITKGVESMDFSPLRCNCRNKEGCPYLGKCRNSIVVYEATCLITGKKYIGNTQQHVKKRMQQHVQDVRKLVIHGRHSDSFAKHFAMLVPPGTPNNEIRKFVKIKVKILWSGKPLTCVKTFGTKSCKLCNKERHEILKLTRLHPGKAINTCSEIHGACRHKPRFHRFNQLLQIKTTPLESPSADESVKDERVPTPNSTTSVGTANSTTSSGSFFDKRQSELLPQPTRRQQVVADQYNFFGNNMVSYYGPQVNVPEGLLARHLLGFSRRTDPIEDVLDNLQESPQEYDLTRADGIAGPEVDV
jgi:hypothetical protein